MATPEQSPDERVLVLMPTAQDAERTRALLAEAGMACATCADVEAVCRELAAGAGVVLLTDEAVDRGRRGPPGGGPRLPARLVGRAAGRPDPRGGGRPPRGVPRVGQRDAGRAAGADADPAERRPVRPACPPPPVRGPRPAGREDAGRGGAAGRRGARPRAVQRDRAGLLHAGGGVRRAPAGPSTTASSRSAPRSRRRRASRTPPGGGCGRSPRTRTGTGSTCTAGWR